jgi:hypothetical protein
MNAIFMQETDRENETNTFGYQCRAKPCSENRYRIPPNIIPCNYKGACNRKSTCIMLVSIVNPMTPDEVLSFELNKIAMDERVDKILLPPGDAIKKMILRHPQNQ